jgi:hypothetical protein
MALAPRCLVLGKTVNAIGQAVLVVRSILVAIIPLPGIRHGLSYRHPHFVVLLSPHSPFSFNSFPLYLINRLAETMS